MKSINKLLKLFILSNKYMLTLKKNKSQKTTFYLKFFYFLLNKLKGMFDLFHFWKLIWFENIKASSHHKLRCLKNAKLISCPSSFFFFFLILQNPSIVELLLLFLVVEPSIHFLLKEEPAP